MLGKKKEISEVERPNKKIKKDKVTKTQNSNQFKSEYNEI